MAARRLVFGYFAVSLEANRLYGRAWGEPVDRARHMPAVEPKGATLTALKVAIRDDGAWVAQFVLGTPSAIVVGPARRPEHASATSCHGAGRRLSRHQALKQWDGRQVVDELRGHSIIINCPSMRGVA